ncbi:transcription initiation factor IIE, beta subunit [Xylariaceae sp. FL0255]|nr:transcription initiation factor IIE, beta subunit [Xylariaceae sp. FL0255]
MSGLTASSKLNGNGKRLAPPSPSANSNASPTKSEGGKSPSSASKRQKRDHVVGTSIKDRTSPTPTPAAAAAAAKATDFGNHMMTQLAYAVDFLKAKRSQKTLQEVLDHLTLNNLPEHQQKVFVNLMHKHSRIEYLHTPKSSSTSKEDKTPSWRLGKYQFMAKIPGVHDKLTLLAYLQQKTDASSLSVKDLKDGWPDCDNAISELEKDHKILVVRTKKDNYAKFIWLDDPHLAHHVDPEFVTPWHKCKLPPVDEMVRKLTAIGQKPASEDPRLKKVDAPKTAAKKRKSTRPPKHQSNSHMAHLLKDYSHMKR